jgi:hypothetical protein
MSTNPEINELEFAQQVRRALDENAACLAPAVTQRLALARRAAIVRRKTEPVAQQVAAPAFAFAGMPAGMGTGFTPAPQRRFSLARFALAWPLVALVVGLVAIASWENYQRSEDLANIDAAMLNDKLPLHAWLDHGFNAYLSHAG